MELTEEQIGFLNIVCEDSKWKLNPNGEVDVDGGVWMKMMNLTEIPVKFGRVDGHFTCSENQLTTLKNCPDYIGGNFWCHGNNLTEYFKSIKEEDFPHWNNLIWGWVLEEYPFLINTTKKYLDEDDLWCCLNEFPLTKLYLK